MSARENTEQTEITEQTEVSLVLFRLFRLFRNLKGHLSYAFVLTISLLFLASCLSANAQVGRWHAQLREALDRNEQAVAERLLREMLTRSPAAFARNNYDYLLARLLERRGANAEAGALFLRVAERNSPLAGYALWHLAEIARARSDSGEEQRLLRRFVSQHPDHLLRERAIQRLSDSYFKTGQYQNTINALRLLPGPRRDALAMIGEAQALLNQTAAARPSFETVLSNGSLDDASLRACLGLDRIDYAAPSAVSENDRLRRARAYQFNRYFTDARGHWLALLRDFPQTGRRAEALFQIGRGYFLENNFIEAAKWYDRVHDEFPQSDEGEQGFYFVGHCHQYLDEADRAIARYEAFLREYPKSEYFGYAHLNAIDTLRSAGRLGEALNWAARAQALNEPFIVVTALFQQARIRLTQGDYAAALADFTGLKSRNLNVRGMVATTNPSEVAFMRGYCLEKLGRFDEATGEYLALPELREGAAGYYGYRASERLRALERNLRAKNPVNARREALLAQARAAHAQGNSVAAKSAANQALRFALDEATRSELLKILRAAYSRLPEYQVPNIPMPQVGRATPIEAGATPPSDTSHQTIANELLFLGLYDEGASELAETAIGKSRDGSYVTAFYCARGDCAHRAVKFSEPILRALPEDYRPELLPREMAEIFYPFPYRDSLFRHAASRGVDPRLVLSIARQETRYNPREKSLQAARGMMQFIPQTASQIAAQIGLRDFEQNDLYHADTAILFGSQYLKNLLVEFGSPEAVAAAYNGSEDSVRRWIGRSRSNEVDRLVIELAKRETKDYVFKVINFYQAYRVIYPNPAQRREQ
jgi:soluble lytic murein transglycosylase